MQTVSNFSRIGEENAFAVLARAAELAASGMDVINLGIGQPDFATPDNIVEAAVKALRDGHHGYTPATGILPLREAVSADLARQFGCRRPRAGADRARRQGHDVCRDFDVWRAGGGNTLP